MVETFFTEKRIIKKIIIVLVFIFMFNFTFSYLGNNVVCATDNGKEVVDKEYEMSEGGGKLLLPIHGLVIFIADAALELMQNSFISAYPITIEASAKSNASWDKIGWVILGATAAIVLGAITFGIGAAAVGATSTVIASLAVTAVKFGGAVTLYVGYTTAKNTIKLANDIQGKFELPFIVYTPENIFGDRIPLFDINFFNPSEEVNETVDVTVTETIITQRNGNEVSNQFEVFETVTTTSEYWNEVTGYDYEAIKRDFMESYSTLSVALENYADDIEKAVSEIPAGEEYENLYTILPNYANLVRGTVDLFQEDIGSGTGSLNDRMDIACRGESISDVNSVINDGRGCAERAFSEINKITDYTFTEEEQQLVNDIVNIQLYDIETNSTTTEEVIAKYKSTAGILQTTVGSMYKTLKTVAIVALLSILVYVGIRIVLSSASKDKAKYKQMLVDWLVAFIMLFVLHYVMAFIIDISESLTNICTKSSVENVEIFIPVDTVISGENGEAEKLLDIDVEADYGKWSTNFMGLIRYYAGMVEQKGYTMKGISYTLMYVVLVIYTGIFTFQYMKRVLYMAFLTMIAPLVAITYPLDKINDGKAQGFSIWLKEYIFNALLQPIHYIIYVIIMGSVMELVVDHPVYALVALGFMVPAEKFIRKMFGFEKASTVGAFGGAAGAAMLMSGVQKLTHKPHKKKDDDNGARGKQDNPIGKTESINWLGNRPVGAGVDVSGDGKDSPTTPRTAVGSGNGQADDSQNIRIASNAEQENNDNNIVDDFEKFGVGHNLSQRISQGQLDEENLPETGREYLEYYRSHLPHSQPSTRETSDTSNFAEVDVETIPTRMPDRRLDQNVPQPGDPYFIGPLPKEKRKLWNSFKTSMAPIGRGMQAVGGHYVRRLDNRLRKARPLRALRRGITYGLGAATLGAIGLAAGIASGDASKALQYTTAGALAGGNLGKNLGETASDIVGLEGAGRAFRAGALGDRYGEIERAKYKRDFKNNVSNYDVGVRNVGAKGWREMSEKDGIIDKGLNYGINNIDDLSNIYNAQQSFINQGYNKEEAMNKAFQSYALNQKFGDYKENVKTRENLEKLLKREGWTDDKEREKKVKEMVDTMNVYKNATLGKIELPREHTSMPNNETERERTNPEGEIPEGVRTVEQEREVGMPDESRQVNGNDDDDDPPTLPNNPPFSPITPTSNQQEERDAIAARTQAVSDANKAEMKRKAKEEQNQEKIRKLQKRVENGERQKAVEKRHDKMKEINNVEGGEQGKSVNELEVGENQKRSQRITAKAKSAGKIRPIKENTPPIIEDANPKNTDSRNKYRKSK